MKKLFSFIFISILFSVLVTPIANACCNFQDDVITINNQHDGDITPPK